MFLVLINTLAVGQDKKYEKVKYIDLYFNSPIVHPWRETSLKRFKEKSYRLNIDGKTTASARELPYLLKGLEPSENKQASQIRIYLEIKKKGFSKIKVIVYDNCDLNIKGHKYKMTKQLYDRMMQLLPLGLREYWMEYYKCN